MKKIINNFKFILTTLIFVVGLTSYPNQAYAAYVYKSVDVPYTVTTVLNYSPSCNAGVDRSTTLPINSVSIPAGGATASDSDGTVASTIWTQILGGVATITNSGTLTPTFSGLSQGLYTFRLTATDDKGATCTDDMNVTVNPAIVVNQAPTANAGADQSITLPTSGVSLFGFGSDPDGFITAYVWTQVSGPSISTIASPSSQFTSVTGLVVAGVYTFRFTVTDNGTPGLTAFDDVAITVNSALAPTGTVSLTGCTISLTQSNCTGTVSWTTANLTANPTAITRNIGSPASFTPSPLSGWSQITTLEYGLNTFYLYHNAVLLNQASIEVKCPASASWNAGSCQTIQPPSGTISATSCTIPAGGSSCPNSVSWTTANLTANPTAITSSTGTPASFTPSPLASGSQSTAITYGWNTFYLYHNAVLLNQVSALALCANGTSWDGSICQPTPTASISASPVSIIFGNSSTLTWSSTSTSTCSGFGSGFNTGGATSGSVSVSPTSTTSYTVSCTGSAGTADAVTTVIVSVPLPACNDGLDNDLDGLKDINDPGCHTDGNAAYPPSYNASGTSEVNAIKRKPIFKDF